MVSIPDLKGHERNTLYIIGNGFDLFHGLKTHYIDFRNWLISNRYDDFVYTMESIFPAFKENEFLLWKDFEKALGIFNPVRIHYDFFQGLDYGWYNEKTQKKSLERIKPYLDKIPEYLREWIKSISIDGIKPMLKISSKSLYLSFNYTLLLEKVYLIPPYRIIHIHECINSKKELVTGHSVSYKNDFHDNNVNAEESVQLITEAINGLKKPVNEIITNNRLFFDSLGMITHVVVFGHSLSEIDRLYFTEVVYHVKDNTKWYFVVHDDAAKANYINIVYQYNDLLKRTIGYSKYKHKMEIEKCSYIATSNLKSQDFI